MLNISLFRQFLSCRQPCKREGEENEEEEKVEEKVEENVEENGVSGREKYAKLADAMRCWGLVLGEMGVRG